MIMYHDDGTKRKSKSKTFKEETTMKIFYACHIELRKNTGNTNRTKIYKTLEEAKAEQDRINSYNSDENIYLRDSYCWKITRHAFKHETEKFHEMNNDYFDQHGDFAYDI